MTRGPDTSGDETATPNGRQEGRTVPERLSAPVQLAVLATAFALGAAIAALLGAANFGTALGIGQLTFAAALVWLLLR
jgi:hypothetical protein